MNHCVPDFELEEEELNINPTSSGLHRQKKLKLPEEDELVELVWQNGQVVMQSQSQRSPKKSTQRDAILDVRSCATAAEEDALRHLFMQEDEMLSWMHYSYPLDDSFDRDFCADLLYTSPTRNSTHSSRITQIPAPASAPRPPPVSLAGQAEHSSRSESRPLVVDKVVRELTVMDSNETPTVALGSPVSDGARSSLPVSCGDLGCGSMAGDAATTDVVREMNCETTVTSSSTVSGGSAEQLLSLPTTADRKRKGREEEEDTECHSEDVESVDEKKQARGSTSGRRTRAAEVHNLSERRRRDRINEKMKALQELIPRCNKSDKASMLDEAIEYLKSLQLQVQMMSMGCSMVPMMFPGVQHYMPPMGMGIGMGMGMSMDMGMSRPMLPFPSVLAGSAIPNPAAAAHLSPGRPLPQFHLPTVSTPDLSRMQAPNQSDPAMNSVGIQSLNQHQVPNFANPYQHYIPLNQMQVPPPQIQAMAQSSTSKGVDAPENHQSG